MSNASTNRIRVLLIDDHVVMRMGLRLVIESQPGLMVVGEASKCADALAIAAREQPEIILLDLDLGAENGLALLPDLLDIAGEARVIVLTGTRDPRAYHQAVHLGALGLVLKEQAVETLVQAIERVHAGEVWLEPGLVARVLAEPAGMHSRATDPEMGRIAALTDREHEVIALICEGLKNRQIAERLSISEATVSHHLTSIFNKLGTATRLELVTYAYRYGLTQVRRY